MTEGGQTAMSAGFQDSDSPDPKSACTHTTNCRHWSVTDTQAKQVTFPFTQTSHGLGCKTGECGKPKMLCKAFKDNQVAHHLASNQQLLTRTKCFAVKCHLFWQFVCCAKKKPEGWLNVEKCSTSMMNTDHLTKGPARIKFDANQSQIQGQ